MVARSRASCGCHTVHSSVAELVMCSGDAGTDASAVLAPQLESCSPVDLNLFVNSRFPLQQMGILFLSLN